jgi:hypothetical protein
MTSVSEDLYSSMLENAHKAEEMAFDAGKETGRKAALLEAAGWAEEEAKRLDASGMAEPDPEAGDKDFIQAICLEMFAARLRARANGV